MNTVYIVAGVSGVGKSTIGEGLAARLSIPFFDADDFHPEANKQKMASGKALNDQDRWPWLNDLATHIKTLDNGGVLACSALKETYRELLKAPNVVFVFLESSPELIAKRLEARKGHFMNPALLKSQFAALEPANYGVHVSVDQSISDIIDEIVKTIT